jgi:voltage-gated potassium channel
VKHGALRPIYNALGALAALLLIGTAGYTTIEGWSFIDAAYMTIVTLSTVGFGETHPLSPTGRVFTVVLIMGGASLAAYAFSKLGEFISTGELRAHLEQRRHSRILKTLKDHVVVCGYGRVGRHVVHELIAEGVSFVVVDKDLAAVEHVRHNGHLALLGNAANDDVLHEAGIERAIGLVAAVNSDAENVFIVLSARGLKPSLSIVARANFEDSESKLRRAGADRVIDPYRISGRRMVTMMLRPEVADFLDEIAHASGIELLIDQVHLVATSPLVGKTVGDVHALLFEKLGVTMLACALPNEALRLVQANAQALLVPDTLLIAFGPTSQLALFENMAAGR